MGNTSGSQGDTGKTDSATLGYTADPSSVSSQQIWREIGSLKELVFSKLVAIEQGIIVAHDDITRVPTEVQKQTVALREFLIEKIDALDRLHENKFVEIDKQFDIIEQARVEQKKDTATAVDAALKAAKEAVTEQNNSNAVAIGKSEASTTKQIDQQAAQMATTFKALDEKINDIKDRITRIESITAGFDSMRNTVGALRSGSDESRGKSAGISAFIGWIIAGLTIVGLVIKLVVG